MRFPAIVLAIFFGAPLWAYPEEFIAKVVKVIDGNTLEIIYDGEVTRSIVLAGIDAPVSGQPFSGDAKKLLEKLVLDKEVRVSVQGKNRHGNYLAIVMIIKSRIDPRIKLLEKGLAWTAEKNPDVELEAIRLLSKERGRGIWKEDNPTPPWIYRRQQSMMQAKSS